MSWNHYNDISELPDHFKNEIQNFFEDYKKLEHKTVKVRDFMDKTVAQEIVRQAIVDYKVKFNKG